jgi:hypothetical protein
MTLKNVISFTAASVTGEWWFAGSAQRAPVKGSLYRALTTSFGTLALGALLVAFVRTAHAMLRAQRRRAAACLVGLVEQLAAWANNWALVYAALSGMPFAPAGRAALELFQRRGWTAIVNADLIGTALAVSGFASAAVGALAGGGTAYVLASGEHRGTQAGVAAALCFFLGLAMSVVLSTIVVSSTRAVFVAWALSPTALALNQPAHAVQLSQAWLQFHPAEFASCGYAAGMAQAVALPPMAAEHSQLGAHGQQEQQVLQHQQYTAPPQPTFAQLPPQQQNFQGQQFGGGYAGGGGYSNV